METGTSHPQYSAHISPTEDIVAEIRNGRMVVLVDDEDRENEGDLIIAAQMATPEAVNFMATYGRGLICLPLTEERIDALGLPLMSSNNQSRHETAFTTSIEAREGVTTGISAADRARTIAVAIDPAHGAADIATPGHIFPLRARTGGVLVRAGHTEASVDLARMAGLNPSAVICEIMNDDGTMARMDDLITFAQKHDLKIGTIADMIAYRRRHERLVERVGEYHIDSRHGGAFKVVLYRTTISKTEHVALIKGDLSEGDTPPLVRMHALKPLEDVLFHQTGKEGALHTSMEIIGERGRGAVVVINGGEQFSKMLKRANGEDVQTSPELRDYGVGAQILLDLGIKDLTLLSNTTKTLVGLEGYDLTIVGHEGIPE